MGTAKGKRASGTRKQTVRTVKPGKSTDRGGGEGTALPKLVPPKRK